MIVTKQSVMHGVTMNILKWLFFQRRCRSSEYIVIKSKRNTLKHSTINILNCFQFLRFQLVYILNTFAKHPILNTDCRENTTYFGRQCLNLPIQFPFYSYSVLCHLTKQKWLTCCICILNQQHIAVMVLAFAHWL